MKIENTDTVKMYSPEYVSKVAQENKKAALSGGWSWNFVSILRKNQRNFTKNSYSVHIWGSHQIFHRAIFRSISHSPHKRAVFKPYSTKKRLISREVYKKFAVCSYLRQSRTGFFRKSVDFFQVLWYNNSGDNFALCTVWEGCFYV